MLLLLSRALCVILRRLTVVSCFTFRQQPSALVPILLALVGRHHAPPLLLRCRKRRLLATRMCISARNVGAWDSYSSHSWGANGGSEHRAWCDLMFSRVQF